MNDINVDKSAPRRIWPFALTPKSARSSLFWENAPRCYKKIKSDNDRETLRIRNKPANQHSSPIVFSFLFFSYSPYLVLVVFFVLSGLKVLSM